MTRLQVENLTDYEWRIAVTATVGHEVRSSQVPARGFVELGLSGGDYLIEQAVVPKSAGPALLRRLPARLEPGQTYRWQLDTLLSDSSAHP